MIFDINKVSFDINIVSFGINKVSFDINKMNFDINEVIFCINRVNFDINYATFKSMAMLSLLESRVQQNVTENIIDMAYDFPVVSQHLTLLLLLSLSLMGPRIQRWPKLVMIFL